MTEKVLLTIHLDEAVLETVRSINGGRPLRRPEEKQTIATGPDDILDLEELLNDFNPRVAPHEVGLRRIYSSLRRQCLLIEAPIPLKNKEKTDGFDLT